MILRSVIVTAAHCIQTFGSGAAIFTNHRFIPAHYQPGKTEALRAPYGTWTWAALTRPASWADGTDTGSGAARDNDLAVIVLAKDAGGRFIGDVTGKLGYAWSNYAFPPSSRTGKSPSPQSRPWAIRRLFEGGRHAAYRRARLSDHDRRCRADLAGQQFHQRIERGPWLVNFRSANPVLSAGAGLGSSPKWR